MDFVLSHLAVGNRREAAAPPGPIGAVLCVAEELTLGAPGVPGHRVPIRDMRPIPHGQLEEALVWLAARVPRYPVLVYCNAGVGRSPSVAIGYLCCLQGMGFGEAVEHVARRRPRMSTMPCLLPTIERVCDRMRALRGHG